MDFIIKSLLFVLFCQDKKFIFGNLNVSKYSEKIITFIFNNLYKINISNLVTII